MPGSFFNTTPSVNTICNKLFLLLSAAIIITGCRKKEWEEFYARPAGLEPPIYQQLQSKGQFKTLLSLIDKAGYKHTLESAGYWTMFAPTDSAFEKDASFTAYLQSRKVANIQSIDSATAQGIIQYMLVYNAFNKDRIDDYQSNAGWLVNEAFRRRTAFYSGFYTDTTKTGEQVTAIASNRNGSSLPYVAADNNSKHIPYFTDTYFTAKNLTASDYTYFYPGSSFSGFNVASAKVTAANVPAENGVIHIIDRVMTPLPSIEEYLRDKPEYSEFRKLYNKYMVTFIPNADATRRYHVLTGEDNQVYVKVYSSLLAFSPNNENHMKVQDNDAQQNEWSIFVPKNDVLLNYINTVILEHFKTFENAPPQIVADLLNAHMWQSAVWPSKFNTTLNFLGEEARFNAQTDVTDRKVLSNGLFYGTTKVQEANVFSSVYSKAYLDPKYSMMTRLLDAELKFLINSPRQQYTLFMISDAVLKAAGYDYDPSLNLWSFTSSTGIKTSGEGIRQRLLRILNTSVIQTPAGELNNLSGSGIIDAYNGEYIKFNNNRIITGGTTETGRVVTVDSMRLAKNGRVYYLNGLLTFAEQNIGFHIRTLGSATTSEFNYFWQFLLNSSASYTAASGEIIGTSAGSFYTVFIPTNAAIQNAVRDGVLPGDKTTGVPLFNPTTAADKELVNRFVAYHILNKKTVIPDGKESGAFETLLKNSAGDVLPVTVLSQPGAMQVTDMNNRKANVILASSNNLSNRTVIHLIDNYLRYNY
jgi:uncharacterized surface protein with fasciclin (FAS1) repeats